MADRRTASEPVCLMTGTSGFVGRGIKRLFESRGWRVRELTRRPLNADSVQFALGQPVAPSCLTGAQALVHCAYDFSPTRWTDIRAINVEGSRQLLDAATAAGVERTVCISSISAFSGCRSRYGRAKLEIERLAHEHDALIVRPGLVLGGEARGGMFAKLVAQVRSSSILPLVGSGKEVQYLVHIDDLADPIERFASGSATELPRLITLANSNAWTMRDLLRGIAGRIGKEITLVPVPWRLPWLALKLVESAGIPLAFRSDSVVSLIFQNPHPDFSAAAEAGLSCRPLDFHALQL